MKKNIIGIYKITNIINGKFYIGSSKKINRRWIEHKCELRNNKHSNQLLQRAWNKYGEDNFTMEIVELVDDLKELRIIEQNWLIKTNCTNHEIGYNISLDTIKFFGGRKMTEEHKRKISEANKGTKHSPEAVEKTRQAHIGMKFSSESLKLMSDAKKGEKNNFYGKKHSAEAIEKMKNADKTYIEGSNCHFAKLDENNVRTIKKMINEDVKVKDIAKKFNVSIHTIYHIKQGLSWKHVDAL